MKIIAINKKGRNYSIKFNNNSTLILDGDLLSKFNLYEDLELSEADVNVIIAESEFRKAYGSALRILARRSHSISEIKTKLRQKKHESEAIGRVIDRLVELNYLDDEKFAKEYIEHAVNTKNFGRVKIVHELRKRGVASEIIDNSFAGGYDETFIENASILAEKKLNSLNIDRSEKVKIRQKLFSFLQQKGYETDIIYQVLNNMNY